MKRGKTMGECPISTADGIRAADVAWASPECLRELGNRKCFVRAPEICVEIISPANSDEEIREKMQLYFDAGAHEIWICGAFGKMTFFKAPSTPLLRSTLCPEFPAQI